MAVMRNVLFIQNWQMVNKRSENARLKRCQGQAGGQAILQQDIRNKGEKITKSGKQIKLETMPKMTGISNQENLNM